MTIGPRFERTTIEANSEFAKSSARYTEKVPSKEPSTIDVLPNAAEVQIDYILANQQTIIMTNQHALKRRMDKMKSPILQMLKALQKGNPKGNE